MSEQKRRPSNLRMLIAAMRQWLRGFLHSSRRSEPQRPVDQSQHTESVAPAAAKELFVVWDALGDGRLVGVFTDESLVKEILTVNPFYYRYYRCRPGEPAALALHWLDDTQRSALLKILNCNISAQRPNVMVNPQTIPEGEIRLARPDELDQLTEIWLQTSMTAHNFISSEFWQTNRSQMRNRYLPAAENWLYCENGRITGFFSIMHGRLAALFVLPEAQGHGTGRKLLDHAKSLHPNLTLSVYEQNTHAVKFYARNGFVVVQSQKDPHTGHNELIMHYEEKVQRR